MFIKLCTMEFCVSLKAKFRFLVFLYHSFILQIQKKINKLHQQVKIEYWLYLSEPKIINNITGDGEI